MIIFLGLIVFFLVGLIVFPVETRSLRPDPRPCASYEESLARVQAAREADPQNIAEHGHLILKTHGKKAARAIVLYHGFTNCPRQYEQLAQRFFEAGFNVYVPRVPYHGIGDRLTKEIGRLTVQELRQVCDSSVDIARGLGDKVIVLGLSMGGVMSAWNAQFREGIDQAFVLVPSFGWYYLPGCVKPLINLSGLFPDQMLWWDPAQKEKRPCPFSMYHHFSSRGMGHIFRLGLAVLRAARKKAPLTRQIVMMTNDLDLAVDKKTVTELTRNWRRHGVDIVWHRFPKDMKMEHDIIDPLHPYSRVDEVYDRILELVI